MIYKGNLLSYEKFCGYHGLDSLNWCSDMKNLITYTLFSVCGWNLQISKIKPFAIAERMATNSIYIGQHKTHMAYIACNMACNIVLATGHMGFVTKVWYKWWCIWASLPKYDTNDDAYGHHTSYHTCCRAVSHHTLGCTAYYIIFNILCMIICNILW